MCVPPLILEKISSENAKFVPGVCYLCMLYHTVYALPQGMDMASEEEDWVWIDAPAPKPSVCGSKSGESLCGVNFTVYAKIATFRYEAITDRPRATKY